MEPEISVRFGFYPDGKRRAVTFSYDDARVEDRRLAELFRTYGAKATFHINSSNLGRVNFLDAGEIKELFAGHEIASHGLTHPWLERLPPESFAYEILEDRRRLESLCGYPVRGLSYPWGTCNDEVVAGIRALGIRYARTIQSSNQFHLPENFLRWNPTCHHNADLMSRVEPFRNARPFSLFYVWGHSFEFTRDGNWDMMSRFCEALALMEDVWFATNIEIYDYITALRGVSLTVDRRIACNPSGTDIWLEVDGDAVRVPAGQTVCLR